MSKKKQQQQKYTANGLPLRVLLNQIYKVHLNVAYVHTTLGKPVSFFFHFIALKYSATGSKKDFSKIFPFKENERSEERKCAHTIDLGKFQYAIYIHLT